MMLNFIYLDNEQSLLNSKHRFEFNYIIPENLLIA